MPYRHTLVIDVASCPIDRAEDYIDVPSAPSNWKDPVKIAAYQAEKRAERIAEAGLDLDLARISCVGWKLGDAVEPAVVTCRNETEEREVLLHLAAFTDRQPTLITYNGHSFDLPLIMRRARYLGVPFPAINIDRYKSYNLDLMAILTDRDPSRRRSLSFYVKRLGWTDLVKPLSGAQEATAPAEGKWDELCASVKHDVLATGRLAAWLGLLEPVSEPVL